MFTLILGFFFKGVVAFSYDLWRLLLPRLFQGFSHTPSFWRNYFDSKTTLIDFLSFSVEHVCDTLSGKQPAEKCNSCLRPLSVLIVVDVHLYLITAKNINPASVLEFLNWSGEGGEILSYLVLYLQTFHIQVLILEAYEKHIWERR